MLTGKKLGDALREAIRLKNVSKAEVARHFEVKGPSVYDWINHGRIGKQHIEKLVAYFSDVVPSSHWGIVTTAIGTGSNPTIADNDTAARFEGIRTAQTLMAAVLARSIPDAGRALHGALEKPARHDEYLRDLREALGAALPPLPLPVPKPRAPGSAGRKRP